MHSAGIQGSALPSPLQGLWGEAPGPVFITSCSTVWCTSTQWKAALSPSSNLSGWERSLLIYTRTMAQPQTAFKKTSAREQTVRTTPWFGTKYGHRTWNSLSVLLRLPRSSWTIRLLINGNSGFGAGVYLMHPHHICMRQAKSKIIWQIPLFLDNGDTHARMTS